MTLSDLRRQMAGGRVVQLTDDEWAALAPSLTEVERHATGVAGDLMIVRDGDGFAAVEQPAAGQRVVRRPADEEEVRRFVEERLAQYERMWDGCGCKIDYYA